MSSGATPREEIVQGPKSPSAPCRDSVTPADGVNLSDFPPELLEGILLKLDPISLAAAAQTSKYLNAIVVAPSFLRAYTSFSAKEYNLILTKTVPDIFGIVLGQRIQTLLRGVPRYAYGLFFRDLIAEKNADLLKKEDHVLSKEISDVFLNEDVISPNNIAKFFALTSKANTFFTADMGWDDRNEIIRVLSGLSVEQIEAIAQSADTFFAADMNWSVRLETIKALSGLSVEQIEAVATQAGKLFTADMHRSVLIAIIPALSGLSVEQMEAVITQAGKIFTVDMHWIFRIELIRALAKERLKGDSS